MRGVRGEWCGPSCGQGSGRAARMWGVAVGEQGGQRAGFGAQLSAPPCAESPWVPLRVRILHQGRTLREVRANITVEVRPSPPASPRHAGSPGARAEPRHCAHPPTPPSPLLQDPDFAEVLSDLSARELQWLVQGQLRIVAETEGRHARQLAGTITARRGCDSEHGHPGAQGAAVAPSPASPPPPPRSSLPGFKPSRACCAGRTPCCRPRRGPWARPSWPCTRTARCSTR